MLRDGKNNSLDVDGNVTTTTESRLILLGHLSPSSRAGLQPGRCSDLHTLPSVNGDSLRSALIKQIRILLFQTLYQGKKASSKTTPYWSRTIEPLQRGLRHFELCFRIARKAFPNQQCDLIGMFQNFHKKVTPARLFAWIHVLAHHLPLPAPGGVWGWNFSPPATARPRMR